ncbi:unnamed protein product [Nippostrongylus brasiliensis]|uniref:Adenylate cyclase n=1 Tax=Nippostrongylus brasiliensis TaxID=27835 RepID=A0A0N4YPI2_NIPBR|nr:unnamed protein product [Nippostrongylus brasiliensis]
MDALKSLRMEIPLFLYMLTSYLKYPVFQNLMYEKICLARYDQDIDLCSNVSAYYDDVAIQTEANQFYFLSSLILTLPSLFTTLVLGAVSDIWSIKVPLLVPFVGVIMATTNYIIQAAYMSLSVYQLLISDAVFAVCGATTLSYGVKTTATARRSIRIAGVEGAIGLGGTIGYALSGTIREPIWQSVRAVTGYRSLLTSQRRFRHILLLNLLAFGVELLIFAGLMDIQYSYLRFKLGWGDKQYGWFSGLQFGITTAAVMIVYPSMYIRGFTDGVLGCIGLISKIISLIMLAFVANAAMAYSVIIFTALNRFVSTAFRSFISSLIEVNEQGKMFSLVALLEGITGLLASAIFNNLYPKTLSFFPGLFYVASAVALLFPVIILGVSDRKVNRASDSEPESTEEFT